MQQDLFESCVLRGVYISLNTNTLISECAHFLAKEYSHSYVDDGLEQDLVKAASVPISIFEIFYTRDQQFWGWFAAQDEAVKRDLSVGNDLFNKNYSSIKEEILRAWLLQIIFSQQYFEPSGERRKKKYLNGALFNKARNSNPNRVEDLKEHIACYHILSYNARICQAPPNYRPGQRHIKNNFIYHY